ncbi:MAG: gamma-glutamylcyclotransferase, partial [Chloroflexi bacterium]|nr:gamma-glutamylcyclotransferase [Chloroflexota bacterium]
VPKAYCKEYNFEVVQPDGSTVQTYTYIANKYGSFKPHRDYLYKIIKGAQKWGLPPAYIEKLKQIPYKEDS